jgi:hypothetical protein
MALSAAQIALCAAMFGAGVSTPAVVQKVKKQVSATEARTAQPKKDRGVVRPEPAARPGPSILDCPTPGLSAGTELMEIAPIKPLETAPAFPGTGFVVEDYSIIGRPGDVPAIPEGTTWLYMIAGFGLVGMAARKRRLV